jgi:hypothetical protein
MEFICKRNPQLIHEYKLYLEVIILYHRQILVVKSKKQMKSLQKWEVD